MYDKCHLTHKGDVIRSGNTVEIQTRSSSVNLKKAADLKHVAYFNTQQCFQINQQFTLLCYTCLFFLSQEIYSPLTLRKWKSVLLIAVFNIILKVFYNCNSKFQRSFHLVT